MLFEEAWAEIANKLADKSPETLRSYRRWWFRLADFCVTYPKAPKRNGSPEVPLDKTILAAFDANLRNPKREAGKLEGNSVSSAIGAIRGCYKALLELDLIEKNPAAVMHGTRRDREPAKRRRIPSDERVKALFAEIDARRDGVQIRAFYALLLYTAVRFSEARWLTWVDVLGYSDVIVVQAEHAKGGKSREVPRADGVERDLKAWRAQARFAEDDDYVFSSRTRGKPLAESTIRFHFVYPFRDIISDLNPHLIRHLSAEKALEHGSSLDQVQTLLGHADPGTTRTYTRQHAADLKAVSKSMDEFRREIESDDSSVVQPAVEPTPAPHAAPVRTPKPAAAADNGPWPEPTPPNTRVLSGAEVRSILGRCEAHPSAPRISVFVALGLFAGLSIVEAQHLTWGEASRADHLVVRNNVTYLADDSDPIETVWLRGPEHLRPKPKVLTYYLSRLRTFLGSPSDGSYVLQFGASGEPVDAPALVHWLAALQSPEQRWAYEDLSNTLADLLWEAEVPRTAGRTYGGWARWYTPDSAGMAHVAKTIDWWAERILPETVRAVLKAQD